MLAKLAVEDARKQAGIEDDGPFHYIGGLDENQQPFIRIDLDPVMVNKD